MRYFSIGICLCVLTSCWTGFNWTQFQAEGIPGKDEDYNDLIFVNNDLGYMGGSHLTLSGDIWRDTIKNIHHTPVFYKTNDQGKSWSSIPLPFNGSVQKIIPIADTLILLIQDPVQTYSSYIIHSEDKGKHWKVLLSLPSPAQIIDVSFTSLTNWKVLFADRVKSYLLGFNGVKTDTLITFNNNPDKILNNKIIRLLPRGPNTVDFIGYTVTDVKSSKSKAILFDKPYIINSETLIGDALFIAVRNNKQNEILKLNLNGFEIISLGNYSDFVLHTIVGYGNTIMALGNRKGDVGPFFVNNTFLISKDAGKSWSKEHMPDDLYNKPVNIFKDQFFISYAGTGAFQIRK
jgi:hypothetical protein